jgi:glutamate N-acetyltransferase/amino-acid N-acetyltransferase
MGKKSTLIQLGTVTSPRGFQAGAVYAGIKNPSPNILDLGLLVSEVPCSATGLFTTNQIKAAPVVLSKKHLSNGIAQAVIMNSGCANACTGEQGFLDAMEIAIATAQRLSLPPENILMASTGVIGKALPIELIKKSIPLIKLSPHGGHDLEQAIMTTDTKPKEIAYQTEEYIIGGIAKGSGMIHPDMATLLCLLTTDADVEPNFLEFALKEAVGNSLNMISVDGDTSTNDTVFLLSNSLSGSNLITKDSQSAELFQQTLNKVCINLAKNIVRDGEGAKRLIEVSVNSAVSIADARRAARTIVSSPLVKSAIYGADPNWGRIMAAIGRSGVDVIESKIDLYIDDIQLVKAGEPLPFDYQKVSLSLNKPEVLINVELNQGKVKATAWGCDLSEEYITINSHYTT